MQEYKNQEYQELNTKYTGDFETATWLDDETYVWAWAVCEIGNTKNLKIGNNIESFIEYCSSVHNPTIYFHNLKFDSEFIICYLLCQIIKLILFMQENFSEIPITLKNGYILIQDIKNETTSSGIIIPDETYNRFARVVKTYEGSTLSEGDIIIKPIGRTTPIKINDVIYDCLKEGFVFAKVIND